MVSVRSSHLPFKMHKVGFRALKSPVYLYRRANRTVLTSYKDEKYFEKRIFF